MFSKWKEEMRCTGRIEVEGKTAESLFITLCSDEKHLSALANRNISLRKMGVKS